MDAQAAILKLIESKSDKITDLKSLEVDCDLIECNKVCIFVVT